MKIPPKSCQERSRYSCEQPQLFRDETSTDNDCGQHSRANHGYSFRGTIRSRPIQVPPTGFESSSLIPLEPAFPQRTKWRLSRLRARFRFSGDPGPIAHAFEEVWCDARFCDLAHIRGRAGFVQQMQSRPQGAYRVDISYFRGPDNAGAMLDLNPRLYFCMRNTKRLTR